MPKTEDVASRLEAERRGLLDLSLRNPLLNYVPRSRGLEIAGESPAQVARVLVRERKRMSFRPAPVRDETSTEAETVNQDDLVLQTTSPAGELPSRLLATYYAARTSLEEHGVNTLFLALGMLRWIGPDEPGRDLLAPLLLVPVELERSHARDRFRLRYSEEDVQVNLSLIEKVRLDFGVTIPDLPESDELDVDRYFETVEAAVKPLESWSVERGTIVLGLFSFDTFLMYRDLDEDVWPEHAKPSQHPLVRAMLDDGFHEPAADVGEDEALDRFLDPATCHQVVDADSSQVQAILDVNQGRNIVIQGPPGTGKSQTITNLIAEAIGRGKTVLFVAEKLAALEVVKRRLDAIGLGDACLALHSHKTRKRALLDELRRTLELGRPRSEPIEDELSLLSQTRDRLNVYCEALRQPIGESGVTPYQAFGALIKLRGPRASEPPKPLEIPAITSWPRSDLRRRQALVEELQSRVAGLGVPREHPFWGTRRSVLLPTEGDRLRALLGAARRAIDALREASETLARRLHLPTAGGRTDAEVLIRAAHRIAKAVPLTGVDAGRGDWLERREELQELIDSGTALAEIKKRDDEVLLPEAWDEDVHLVRRDLNAAGRHWWRWISPSYYRAKGRVAALCRSDPPTRFEDRLRLLDDVIAASRHREVVARRNDLAADLFGARWQGERSNWSSLGDFARWATQLHVDIRARRLPGEILGALGDRPPREESSRLVAAVKAALDEHREAFRRLAETLEFDAAARFGDDVAFEDRRFDDQAALVALWSERIDDLPEFVAFNHLAGRCRDEGLAEVVALAESWPAAAGELVNVFRRHGFEALLTEAFRSRPALAGFDGRGHEHAIERFRELDRLALVQARARLAAEHRRRLPGEDGGEPLARLRREFEKKTRHLPVRQLLTRAGSAVQAIKPVFMMSPLSVAAYLAPDSITFDLVIFDEASQVRPVDALGAIVRGKQVVVVGDSRQLPPTDFFERLAADDEDEMPSRDVESILGLFVSQGAPQRQLRWHYRSRHESLIAVSNREFYDDRLVVFPSPDAARREVGLVVRHLPETTYDRGKSRTNAGEADAVARAAFAHAREQMSRPIDQRKSLGVVAFSMAQTEAIRERVERLRRDDPSCEEFFAAGSAEPFFVKNLENVQGDERDVIFISVGYGRTASGAVPMGFGPLNGEGGERRLNVLITRARYRCEVFTNLTARDIDLDRSRSRGVEALKTFLAFAEDGGLPSSRPSQPSAITSRPFEEAVRSELMAAGHRVVAPVGPASSTIEMAIDDPDHPGRYLVGIECDGPAYLEARSARDRDRLRPELIQSLGWRIRRVWSTDWVRNPSGELKRLVALVEEARRESAETAPPVSRESAQHPANPRAERPDQNGRTVAAGSDA